VPGLRRAAERATRRHLSGCHGSIPRREGLGTGSVRDTREGKGRFDLLPPYAVSRLAKHFENGAAKYGDRNWEMGQDLSRYLDSGLRHIFAFLDGARDEDHLAAAAWNILACIETEHRVSAGLLPAELNNLPKGTRNG
jgi:hypothetical protein